MAVIKLSVGRHPAFDVDRADRAVIGQAVALLFWSSRLERHSVQTLVDGAGARQPAVVEIMPKPLAPSSALDTGLTLVTTMGSFVKC
jgi:hypothetical protein